MTKKKKFSVIYNEFYSKIVHYLTRMVGEYRAEDVAQEVFEKVNRGLKDFKGQSKLSTWIYRIATNAALDKLKSLSSKHSFSGALVQFPIQLNEVENVIANPPHLLPKSPDQQIIHDEMNECIREFVDRLVPDYRTIIILNELEGFTNKEIADVLEISLDAAKIRLHRARAKLKKELEDGCDFYHDSRNELACDRKQPNRE